MSFLIILNHRVLLLSLSSLRALRFVNVWGVLILIGLQCCVFACCFRYEDLPTPHTIACNWPCSLSLVDTSLPSEAEPELRCYISRRLSKGALLGGMGNIATVELR